MAEGKVSPVTCASGSGCCQHQESPGPGHFTPRRVDNHGPEAQQPSLVLGSQERWVISQGQGAKFKSHGSAEESWSVSHTGPTRGQEIFF